jgi:hypothetical protein
MHLSELYPRTLDESGENPPVGLILCTQTGAAQTHYSLDNLPNKMLAAEYQTVLRDEKLSLPWNLNAPAERWRKKETDCQINVR